MVQFPFQARWRVIGNVGQCLTRRTAGPDGDGQAIEKRADGHLLRAARSSAGRSGKGSGTDDRHDTEPRRETK